MLLRPLKLLLCVLAFLGGGAAAFAALHRDAIDRLTGRSTPTLHCRASSGPTCVAVRGRVVYVEATDPDGDGDLHVVVRGGSVTKRGFSAVKVERDLRPGRVPRLGDVISATGYVQQGSHGEQELHAVRFAS